MYGVRERMPLRHLVEVEGRTQSAAARELGIHRKTLQRWIADGLLDTELELITARYGPRPPVPTKLDPVKPLIAERLAEYPRLSAKRLLEECRGAGYTGGYTRLCDHVRTLPPAAGARPGRALRDAARSPGAGRLRVLPIAMGHALRADRGARLLAAPAGARLICPSH